MLHTQSQHRRLSTPAHTHTVLSTPTTHTVLSTPSTHTQSCPHTHTHRDTHPYTHSPVHTRHTHRPVHTWHTHTHTLKGAHTVLTHGHAVHRKQSTHQVPYSPRGPWPLTLPLPSFCWAPEAPHKPATGYTAVGNQLSSQVWPGLPVAPCESRTLGSSIS